MFKDSIDTLNNMAVSKKKQLETSKLRYFLSACLAGAYVGIGIILILSIGAPLAAQSSAVTTLVMGLSFGIALTLVIFAGSELFTGNNMVFTVSTLSGKTTWKDLVQNWIWCYAGNFVGTAALCGLIIGAGVLNGISSGHLLFTLAEKKTSLGSSELFFRGILCNWLVCLAIWTAIRTKNDVAKLILIFWMLFTFIASGYEHSIANMTVLGLAMFYSGGEVVTLGGYLHNIIPVTLGNIVGGGLFVGSIYWLLNTSKRNKQSEKQSNESFRASPIRSAKSL
ncbi:formate/nitrite transporter family protein [Alkalicoccobacillus plakortidis]|uniref:Formate/nitrite transporter family protein n=1 Tax=Alkalicoccobacillus plakortidis TaxID=444060 RepID=A0ABT0XK55_9BACI|nr:formate/nitrite transporter family protein [Alkalicoccobacillus plakortidis]MCM2676125.1 formate/nitrite transporter family protein [Alkalicoccobacillus plakortidis]